MDVAKILVGATSGIAQNRQRIPARAAGLTVSVVFTDPVWDNLTKTVVFRGTGSRISEFDGKTAVIPWEVLGEPGTRVYFGIYGTNQETGMELPLIEVDVGITERSTDPQADPGTDPTLPIWAQLKENVEELQQTGGPSSPGKDGGYYTPEVTQPDEDTIQFNFNPSSPDMPTVEPVAVELPSGQGSGGNVDLSGYLKLPTNEDGTPNHGTVGYYAVSDGNGGITWVEAGNSGGGSGGETPEVPDTPTTHGIVWDLVNVTSSNNVASVTDGASLTAVLTPADGYTLGDVTVTMGGEVLTGVWNAATATVTIASVTGDVIVSCSGVAESTGEPVDTSPVIAQENTAYGALSSAQATVATRKGSCITVPYTFPSMIDYFKSIGAYDEETGKITDESTAPHIAICIPFTKYNANAEANGYPTSSMLRYQKIVSLENDTIVGWRNNYSTAGEVKRITAFGSNSSTAGATGRANAVAFTLSMDDADDSYAYWTNINYNDALTESIVFPDGIRNGDIIFAGKNTEYYGMANIDGTLPGQTVTAELSYDDDVAQNYAVATVSILGEETATDTTIEYGVSSELAAVIDQVRTAWMLEYGGDYRKIPLIITTDQHGDTYGGIFKMLGKTLSMHDVSKICNLGDTVSTQWFDEDTTKPLVSCTQLKEWCESIKHIPFSKRLDVYGNHDTWYGNYEDEGNTVGTRYPANLSHLDQYFRNIYARRNNNNGWFVVRDDYFNVKYVIVSGFEYQGTVTFRIGTKQMQFIIDEFSKDDGYDIVVVSHVPLYYQASTNGWPTETPDDVSDTNILRVAAIDTDALFTARKNRTSGTVTDSEGVEHTFDFSDCTTDILCSLHGHTHNDSYNYTGGVGLLSETFDWSEGSTFHFILVDRVNRQLNVWKLEGDGLTFTNYQVPFDKPTE